MCVYVCMYVGGWGRRRGGRNYISICMVILEGVRKCMKQSPSPRKGAYRVLVIRIKKQSALVGQMRIEPLT